MIRIRSRYAIIALAIALAIAGLLAGHSFFSFSASAATPLKSIIVQLKSDPVVLAQAKAKAAGQSFNVEAYRQQVIAEQQRFLNKLTLAGVPYTISSVTAPNGPITSTYQFKFNYVYNGIGMEVPEQTLPIFEKIQEVLGVFPNDPVEVHLDHAVDYTRAPQLYGNPPRLTGFDTLNTGGIEGDGVNIAIIDTGVDWSHPMFGGDPTPPQFGLAPPVAALNTNKKVIYYLNLTAGPIGIGDDFGHGTHVAGIAAGYRAFAPGPDGLPLTADDIAIHGAAPQARIMAYKTLSAAGVGVSTSIIAAIEDAVQPRTITGQVKPVAHVINMSLGSQTPQGPDYPTSVAADNAAIAGTVVVASAGNSGVGDTVAGTGTIGGPGSGRHVITVGADIDPGAGPNALDVVGGGRTGMKAYLLGGSADILSDVTNNYVFCGLAETPDQVPDSVSGKIALIARGSTVTTPAGAPASAGTGLASNKVAFATAKGAIAVVIYNDVDGEITNLTARKTTIPAVGINRENGLYLKSLIGSSDVGAVSAQMIKLNKAQIFEPVMADFSSRGPVIGYGQVKPDVTAPGVNILSATVAVGGVQTNTGYMFDPSRYISVSGTSMSSPMTAGIVALIKQKHSDWTPSMVRAALVNSASNLRQDYGAPVPDGVNSINEQGGGLVDALAAANTKAVMGVGQLGPTGQPGSRTFEVLGQPTPANPDFTPSFSFGEVPIANVIGTATISQTTMIFDTAGGAGAGTYRLSVIPIRSVDQSGFRVTTTDANGNRISSVNVSPGGSASFNVKTEVNGQSVATSPTQAQWYIVATRTDGGQRLRMPFYYRAISPNVTLAAPGLLAMSGNEVSGAPPIDINGSYSLPYSFVGSPAPAQFRIEEQKNSAGFAVLADVTAGQTSHAIDNRGNGFYDYRVAGLFTVQYGLLQGPYSVTQTVQVDRRLEADVTSLIQTAVSNVSLAGGVFEFDQTLKNQSAGTTILPPLRFNITGIESATGTVRASNADNGGDGFSGPALWDYSNALGSDRALTSNEVSGARHLKFTDPSGELFTFTAIIKGNFPDPAFSAASVGGSGSARKFKVTLRFVADPVNRSVSLASVE